MRSVEARRPSGSPMQLLSGPGQNKKQACRDVTVESPAASRPTPLYTAPPHKRSCTGQPSFPVLRGFSPGGVRFSIIKRKQLFPTIGAISATAGEEPASLRRSGSSLCSPLRAAPGHTQTGYAILISGHMSSPRPHQRNRMVVPTLGPSSLSEGADDAVAATNEFFQSLQRPFSDTKHSQKHPAMCHSQL